MQGSHVKGYHLSTQQTRLWMQQGRSQVWYAQCAVWLHGKLDIPSFCNAVQHLTQQHDILRTAFRHIPGLEIPIQVVADHLAIACPLIDLEHLTPQDQHSSLNELLTRLPEAVSDVKRHPLLTTALVRLAAETHLFLLCLPSLCADAYTLMRMITEVCQIYSKGDEQFEEPLQYAEVAAWQEQLQQSEEAEALRAYWQKIDLSHLATTSLPFAQPIALPDSGSGEGQAAPFALATYEIALDDHLAMEICQQAQHYNASVEAWLLACWRIALWRLNGMEETPLGVACNGRSYEELTEELAKALGLYTRVLPLEIRLEETLSFANVVKSSNTSLLAATKRQNYFSWENVVPNNISPEYGSAGNFFPLSFEYTQWPAPCVSNDVQFSLYKSWCCFEKTLLKLSAVQSGERIQVSIHYSPQQSKAAHIEQLASAFLALLRAGLAQPEAQITTFALLEPERQKSLLRLGCAPTRVIPPHGLRQCFEVQVLRQPDQPAVIDKYGQLTYRQLNERSNQLARVLQQRGVGPNVLVGLMLPRQAVMLVGLLGILKANGAYLPLERDYPATRIAYQLNESQATLLLTQTALGLHLPEWDGQILCMEELEAELVQNATTNPPSRGVEEDLAYCIYTSGSTGRPKGVMIRQSSVVNYTLALCEQLGAQPGWQYATVSTLAADLGNTAIFCALASGGCVQVLDTETVTSVEAMTNWAREHPIDVLKIVPSHLSALLEGECVQDLLPRRALVLGGEALPRQVIERVRQLGGRCQIYNHYGPTETTIGVLVNPLQVEEPTAEESSVALGRPIVNTQMYVLDRWMQLVPQGVVGELYIGGAGVALGYQQQAMQTAERFVPHPYSQQQGERLYRTGDLVRYGESGKISFVGRSDDQIKLRGYRIEMGEIEAALRQNPLVWDCAVQLQLEGPGAPKLVGYIVARTKAGLGSQDIRKALAEKLPEHMIPAQFVMLESLPLTANGKLDRHYLQQLALSQTVEPVVEAEPRSPLEEVLVQMWKELLILPNIGIDDNFFALGGHSLLATRIIARLQAMFQVPFFIQMLFETPTIAGLAQRIEQMLRQDEGIEIPPLVAEERPEDIPLSFAQQRLWFLDQLEPESMAYLMPRALRFSGDLNVTALEQSLETLIQRHESLRTTFGERAGRPVQIVHPARSFTLPVIDLQAVLSEQREEVMLALVHQEAHYPCNLTKGPMLRTCLLRLHGQEHVILFTLHHIITDKWSTQILIRELAALYQGYSIGQPMTLAPLPIQYADYALWQRRCLQGLVLERLLQYWQSHLSPPLPTLNLPTDYTRAPLAQAEEATRFFRLPSSLADGLNALARQEGATLFMTLLAGFTVLLHYHSGQDDLVIGTDIANRNQMATEGLIGFFVNQLVLRTDLTGNPHFLELIRRVRSVSLKAYTHQDLPFDRLVKALNPQRDLSRTPLFQAKFSLQNVPPQQFSLPQLEIDLIEVERSTSKLDILLEMVESNRELLGWLEYRADLFKEETITRFLQHFEAILHYVIAYPETHLNDLRAMLAAIDKEEKNTRIQELQQIELQKLKRVKRAPVVPPRQPLTGRPFPGTDPAK